MLSHQFKPFSSASAASASSAEPSVLFKEHTSSVFEFVLNKPKVLNSVDTEMCQRMSDKLVDWHKNPETKPRVSLMTGAGGKAFCAGGDIVSIYKGKQKGEPLSKLLDFFGTEYILDYNLSQIENHERIALWNGICMGGGVGLTWHAPIRIATEKSMYAMPETKIGFFTDVGGSYFLPRIKNNDISLGLYLGLTGQRVKGRDLAKYGIATHFVPEDNVEELRKHLMADVKPDSSHDDIEHIVDDHADVEAKMGKIPNHEEIKKIFQPDSIQAIVDRLDKSSSDFAIETQKALLPMSPLSMAVVFEQIVRGSKMSVKEVFEMEYKIAAGFLEHTEFYEGVRALLVDKDN